MNYRKIRESRKRRENIEIVKVRLSNYGKNLKLIDDIRAEIVEKRDRLDALRCGWSDSDPTFSGGTSQEEKIILILDEIKFLEDEIRKILLDCEEISNAIAKLNDNMLQSIVFRLWVYDKYSDKHDTIRGIARKYDLSKNMIWRKSDTALLSIYKSLYND
ncbi:hypothetical protein ANHYDRO_01399 [Anaerococcus hydrogenalis DSM 7454]|uniref:Phage transcriptional regulator, RinA family n=1 Tax=Anaerococcus hydrogenalis DSM 7454 TaxID=561177 RepID=B6W9X3_9FIRM|nr:hypothetical protein [Anaerococcus hydrogenalis]EEB35733.1 hypothetical protein ANHYDRO_01399 [Anaerococcus hydrogenalis DSM 7454]